MKEKKTSKQRKRRKVNADLIPKEQLVRQAKRLHRELVWNAANNRKDNRKNEFK